MSETEKTKKKQGVGPTDAAQAPAVQAPALNLREQHAAVVAAAEAAGDIPPKKKRRRRKKTDRSGLCALVLGM